MIEFIESVSWESQAVARWMTFGFILASGIGAWLSVEWFCYRIKRRQAVLRRDVDDSR